MKHNGQSRVLDNIVSPYGLAMISYAFFLFSCLIPPSVYSHYINEPDLMFLDPATILFYTLCVVAFLGGAWFAGWLMPSIRLEDQNFKTKISPTTFILTPLILGLAFTIVSDLNLIRSSPSVLLFLFAQQGQDLKDVLAFEVEANATLPPLTLIVIVWWAFWRYSELRLRGWRKRLVLITLCIAVLSVIASSILTLSRSLLMAVVCGLAILYVARKTLRGQISFRFIFIGSVAIVACVSLLFFAFSFLRGADSLDGQIYLLFGYTVASYNRLAAIVNGSLRPPFAGRGVLLSSFFAFNRTLNRLIPLNIVMNWPNQLEVFNSQFGAISRAGLDSSLVWQGAFGDIFPDLGWFSCLLILGYGMLYGVVWNWIKRGKVVGVVLYPYFGFCVLFWFGVNLLLASDQAVILVVAILLAGYELILVKPVEKMLNVAPIVKTICRPQ
jgi:hypothetical protein